MTFTEGTSKMTDWKESSNKQKWQNTNGELLLSWCYCTITGQDSEQCHQHHLIETLRGGMRMPDAFIIMDAHEWWWQHHRPKQDTLSYNKGHMLIAASFLQMITNRTWCSCSWKIGFSPSVYCFTFYVTLHLLPKPLCASVFSSIIQEY